MTIPLLFLSSGLALSQQLAPQDRYRQAAQLFQAGNYTEAEAELREVLRVQPEFAEGGYLLARVCAMTDRPVEAEKYLKDSLALKPDFFEAWQFLGLFYCDQKRFALAQEALLKALDLKAENALVHLHLGIALQDLGDNGGAIRAYEHAIQFGKQSPQIHSQAQTNLGLLHIKLATLRSERDNIQEAIAELERARELLSPSPDLLNLLGAAYLRADDSRAIQTLHQAVELNPTDEAWQKLARTLAVHYRLDEAVAIFEEKVKQQPRSELFRMLLGAAYWDKAEYFKAVDQYQQAVSLDPNSARAHYLVGSAYLKMGRPSVGETSLREALQLDSDLVAANLLLADALMEQGKHQEALRFLEKANQKAPGDVTTQVKLGQLYLDLGKFEDGMSILENAVRSAPGEKKAHYLLGRLYAATKRRELAQKEFSIFKSLEAAEKRNKAK